MTLLLIVLLPLLGALVPLMVRNLPRARLAWLTAVAPALALPASLGPALIRSTAVRGFVKAACLFMLAPNVFLLTTGECENNPSCGKHRGQQRNSLWLSERSNSVSGREGFVTGGYMCGQR